MGASVAYHLTRRGVAAILKYDRMIPQTRDEGSKVANYAFDVTPARFVTALITERGVLAPNEAALTP